MIKVGVYFKTVYKMFLFVAFTWFETTTTHILKHIHELKDTAFVTRQIKKTKQQRKRIRNTSCGMAPV